MVYHCEFESLNHLFSLIKSSNCSVIDYNLHVYSNFPSMVEQQPNFIVNKSFELVGNILDPIINLLLCKLVRLFKIIDPFVC